MKELTPEVGEVIELGGSNYEVFLRPESPKCGRCELSAFSCVKVECRASKRPDGRAVGFRQTQKPVGKHEKLYKATNPKKHYELKFSIN